MQVIHEKRKNYVSSDQVHYISAFPEEQKIKDFLGSSKRLKGGWYMQNAAGSSPAYIDAKQTARKNLHIKEQEFPRMMESVKHNEADILLFAGSTAGSGLLQLLQSYGDLQAHNCNWKTTDEEMIQPLQTAGFILT